MGTEFVTYNYNIDPYVTGEVIPRIRICKSIRLEDSSRFRVGQFTFWIEQGVNDFYLINPDSGIVCNGLLITETGGNFIVSQQGDPLLSQTGSCMETFERPRVDMSFSKNGNQSFSNIVGRNLNPEGVYQNQIRWWRMGQANEFTVQLRFWGLQRFVVKDGVAEVMV